MAKSEETTIVDVINDLDAGVFGQKLQAALHSVAEGVVGYGKVGKVSVTFDLKQIASSNQVEVTHKLSFSRPTANGRSTEENTTKTPMHVGVRGKLTLFPESQPELFTPDSNRRGESIDR